MISDEYADHCLKFIDVAKVPRIKAVLDPGNGMGAIGATAIFKRLPLELVKMYFDLDGTFPNHPPDPLEEANRREIMERVAAEGAQIGMAWDGDADRCFFVDDTGQFVPGDFVTALLGESFVRKFPGSKVVYDVRASRAVRDRVQAAGGTALMNRVGHAFIKKRMRDENAVSGARCRPFYSGQLVRRQRHDPGPADARAASREAPAQLPRPMRARTTSPERSIPASRTGRPRLHRGEIRRRPHPAWTASVDYDDGISTCGRPIRSPCA
jgi:hypothetical protein